MRILAIERELKALDPDSARELLREEAACVWALQTQEVIREIWFTRRKKCAVVMLECETEDEARRHLSVLPLVREQFITFDVHALRPYDGFERLLSPAAGSDPKQAPGAAQAGAVGMSSLIGPNP